jgi:hypothetical protein
MRDGARVVPDVAALIRATCFFLTCVCWGQVGHNNETSRADIFYLDSAGFAEFMTADNGDNGKALKSLGLAK